MQGSFPQTSEPCCCGAADPNGTRKEKENQIWKYLRAEEDEFSRGLGGIECVFVRLTCACRRTWADVEHRPGGDHVCLIKNQPLPEMSANKSTVDIIRRPPVIHTFKRTFVPARFNLFYLKTVRPRSLSASRSLDGMKAGQKWRRAAVLRGPLACCQLGRTSPSMRSVGQKPESSKLN